MTKEMIFKNEMGGLMEVKTASNTYIKGKNTITSRIGEEFEPDKPIITYNPTSQKPQKIEKKEDVEELKQDPYVRKKASQSHTEMQRSIKSD